MKVFFDHRIFSAQVYGGVSRYFCEIIRRLQLLPGVEPSTYTPLYRNVYLSRLNRGGYGPIVIDPFGKAGRVVAAVNETLTALHLKSRQYDVIHETWLGERRYSRRHPNVVHTIHDLTPELFPTHFPKYEKSIDLRRRIFKSDSTFIAISENTKVDLIRIFGVSEDRVKVILHGPPALPPSPHAARRTDLALYVGSRGGYKNFECLVEAFRISRRLSEEVELLLFGGEPLERDELQRLERAGIRRFRRIEGGDQALSAAYHTATTFIYPSLYEGFGLPLLEAMMSGCPIVCSLASCFPEIAGEAAYYFDPTAPETLACVLDTIFGNSFLQSSLAEQGAKRVRLFSWDTSAQAHADLYARIAANR